MNLYDILGVASDATKAAIKAAYRAKAKTAHPDAGGSVEQIQALNQAYETLYDDDKRAYYDATGETDAPRDSTEDEALGIVAAFVDRFICDEDAVYKDFISAFKKEVNKELDIARKNIDDGRKFELRTADISNRIKGEKGAALVRSMLATKLRNAAEAIAAIEHQITVRERALQLVEGVEFDAKTRSDNYNLYAYAKLAAQDYQRTRFFQGFDPGA